MGMAVQAAELAWSSTWMVVTLLLLGAGFWMVGREAFWLLVTLVFHRSRALVATESELIFLHRSYWRRPLHLTGRVRSHNIAPSKWELTIDDLEGRTKTIPGWLFDRAKTPIEQEIRAAVRGAKASRT